MAVFKDYNAELKVLQQRQRDLRHKHAQQLGDLVIATGADALDPETLAGTLLAAVAASKTDRAQWQADGARFLQGRNRSRRKTAGDERSSQAHEANAKSDGAQTGAD